MKKLTKSIIKNAFTSHIHRGSSASFDIFEDIDSKISLNKMQAITKKLKLPISCFVKPAEKNGEFYIRYFIEGGEEPICGHGTLVATKCLLDKGLITKGEITYIPMMTPNKPIKAEINNQFISIFIQTNEPKNISLKSKIGKEIILVLPTNSNKKIFDIVDIVEGDLDYTVEISKYDTNMTSEEIIKSINPQFEAIEKIKLASGKICRGIDVVIKNLEKTSENEPDFITRIFLPLGADIKYKEDPACGSGNSYITRYLIKKYPELDGKELKIYQASQAGAFIKVKSQGNGVIKVSGIVK